MPNATNFVMIIAVIVLFAACTSTGKVDQQLPELPQNSVSEDSLEQLQHVGDSLPQLSSLKGVSETAETTLDGIETFMRGGSSSEDGTTLELISTAGELSYGIWSFPVTAEPISLEVNATVSVDQEFWIALSDYSSGRWSFLGPYTESRQLDIDQTLNVSADDNLFAVVLVHDGNTVDILSLKLSIEAESDWQVDTIDSNDSVGSDSSLAIVDGNPAISYYDATNVDLRYVRATDSQGAAWGTPVAVDSQDMVGLYTSLAIVDGNPAISYYSAFPTCLKFVRASNARGSSWGTPVVVDANGFVGMETSLAIVDGNPAISYYDVGDNNLKYVRATDAQGANWGIPIFVDISLDVGRGTSLAIVDGNPAISYHDSAFSYLKFVRASDAQGTGWGTPIAIVTTGDVYVYSSLEVVDGNPAIGYFDHINGDLKYIRATDVQGSGWGTPISIDTSGIVGAFASLAIVNGNPAISYLDSATSIDLKFVHSSDAQGSSWGTPVTVDSVGSVGSYTSLTVVDGKPGISYHDIDNGDLKFARMK